MVLLPFKSIECRPGAFWERIKGLELEVLTASTMSPEKWKKEENTTDRISNSTPSSSSLTKNRPFCEFDPMWSLKILKSRSWLLISIKVEIYMCGAKNTKEGVYQKPELKLPEIADLTRRLLDVKVPEIPTYYVVSHIKRRNPFDSIRTWISDLINTPVT